MADVTFAGFTTPSQPNTGLAVFDADAPAQFLLTESGLDEPDASATVPEQYGDNDGFWRKSPIDDGAAVPVRVMSEQVTSGDIRITLDQPMQLDPGTITHGGALFDVTSLSISGSILIQNVNRFLRRLSKLNRGTN